MALHIPGTRALKVFDAASRHLNFSRAAEEVGLTPAAVSHQIKEMEEQLGLALFVRTSRSIRLTEAAMAALEVSPGAIIGFTPVAPVEEAPIDHAPMAKAPRKVTKTPARRTKVGRS